MEGNGFNKETLPIADENKLPPIKSGGNALSKHYEIKFSESQIEDFGALIQLANFANMTVSELKDECALFEIRKLMSKMTKLVSGMDVSDKQMANILINSDKLRLGEVLVSPAYVGASKKAAIKTKLARQRVSAVIDFPCGESDFKTKFESAKQCVKDGVDGLTVVLPSLLASLWGMRGLKRQMKKYASLIKGEVSIAMPLDNLTAPQIKDILKMVDKLKVASFVIIFGEASYEEVKGKMASINSFKCKKPVKIVANVKKIEGVRELLKMGVDGIITPYADEIGIELVNRFNIRYFD